VRSDITAETITAETNEAGFLFVVKPITNPVIDGPINGNHHRKTAANRPFLMDLDCRLTLSNYRLS
jgi:hypothetical protein